MTSHANGSSLRFQKPMKPLTPMTGLFLAHLLALSLIVLSSPIGAQERQTTPPTDVTTVDKITVTAEKRETDVQTTPIAITVVEADDLERAGIEDTQDLQLVVPNMTFGVINANTQISLRAVGNENITPGGDPGVALHVDGVYLGRPSAALIDYLDLERVEVLRGPQGTLYGRNATGGSINLITKKPSADLSGRIDLGLGDYSRVFGSGAVGGPLREDTIFGRISAASNQRDGYHTNVFDGSELDDSDTLALRGHLEITPGDQLQLLLTASSHSERGTGAIAKTVGDGIADLRSSARDFPQSQDNDYSGLTASITYSSPKLQFVSLSSYQELTTDLAFDGDASPLPIQTITTILDAEQFSQELRLQSSGGGSVEWLAGVYYFTEDLVGDFDLLDLFIGPFNIDSRVETESLGLFGQLGIELGSSARISVGARYNDDEKEAVDQQFFPLFGVDFAIPQQADWQEVTGHVGFDMELSERSFFYARAARGYKSGGFNLPGDGRSYDPETVLSYEVGIKSQLANNRVRLNASAFRYDYQDMQVFQVRSFQTLIENAAESTIQGLEVELTARPAAGTLIQAMAGYLDAEYDSFLSLDPLQPFLGLQDLSGNRLNRAPELSFHLGLQHSFELGGDSGYLTPRVDLSWRDEVFYRQFNNPAERQDAFTRTDFHVVWDSSDGRWNVDAFIKNIEDDDVIGNMLITQAALQAVLYAPQTIGARVGFRF